MFHRKGAYLRFKAVQVRLGSTKGHSGSTQLYQPLGHTPADTLKLIVFNEMVRNLVFTSTKRSNIYQSQVISKKAEKYKALFH